MEHIVSCVVYVLYTLHYVKFRMKNAETDFNVTVGITYGRDAKNGRNLVTALQLANSFIFIYTYT